MTLLYLTKRNIKLFFKDKGLFITSLITPLIILFLYLAFLKDIYLNSFESGIIEGLISSGMNKEEAMALINSDAEIRNIINGVICAQLVSSVLAVSCISISFSANLMMVQDKVTGSIKDISIAPVKKSTIALSYYLGTFLVALIICLVTTAIGLVYMALTNWYLTFSDCLFMVLDVILLVLFGTALSSVVCYPLSTEGQISAVTAIISAGYGFICGAYMPISSFSDTLQKVILFLPGTYGTSIIRNVTMGGAFRAMENHNILKNFVPSMKESIDCKLYFFDNEVSLTAMHIIVSVSIIALILIYIIMTKTNKKRKSVN